MPLFKSMLENKLSWIITQRRRLCIVRWRWLIELKLKNIFSNKIKVGFGPVETAEDCVGSRKFRIDPFVNHINKYSKRYTADIFFKDSDLSKFDIIVIVKNFDYINKEVIKQLKKNNKILVYDILDNPSGCKKNYQKNIWFIKSMNGVILSSPLHKKDIQKYNTNFKLIEHAVINYKYKKDYRSKKQINLIWQGFFQNSIYMIKLHPIIERIKKETDLNIKLIYHTDCPPKKEEMIRYVKWKISDWQDVLVDSDIGVVIKPLDEYYQQRKPSTKILTYMAVGLPIVCTPSEADKLVIKHDKTGYFAYTDKEWYKYLKMLIENPKLREKIGKAAREHVINNFNIKKITKKYIDFFNELMQTKTQPYFLFPTIYS